MTVSLTSIIADLESKIANADSNSSLSDLLSLLNSAERLTGTKSIYDSSDLLTLTDSASIGSVKYKSDGSLRFYNGNIWDLLTGPAPSGPSFTFQGSTSGYKSGGTGPSTVNTIDKWSFSSDGNASDVGDLSVTRYATGGHSSSSDGYTSGGYYGYNTIDKFPFSSDTNASDAGDLSQGRTTVGHSSSESGYSSGGTFGNTDIIDKFPFAADGNATDVGDLLAVTWYNAGISSGLDGYNAGGALPSVSNVIQKFSFSADGNASDVGDLTVAREYPTGTNSDTHGYAAGGNPYLTPGATTIDKFSFTSGGNATDVGDVTNRGSGSTGQSSTASGYLSLIHI